MLRIYSLAMLAIATLTCFADIRGEEPAAPGNADELEPPLVRILSGERTTQADIKFFAFSCEASNPNQSPLMFVGYRSDSFDPPIDEPVIAPIHIIQFQQNGEWEEYPQGWCGTGIDGIELPAEQTRTFGLAFPVDVAGKVVRVGIRWSAPLDFSVAEPDAFKIAWSEPFELRQIDETKDGKKAE